VGVVDDGELAPPSELDAIYHALEALWLNNSLDLKWLDQKSGKPIGTVGKSLNNKIATQ
jgi:hypothetical protein